VITSNRPQTEERLTYGSKGEEEEGEEEEEEEVN
jgi:hypothetical protein